MTLHLFPFEEAHLAAMELQEAHRHELHSVKQAAALATTGPAFTMADASGVYACAGVSDLGNQCGLLWAFISPKAGRHFVQMVRTTRALLIHLAPRYVRLLSFALHNRAPAARLLRVLGFKIDDTTPTTIVMGADGKRRGYNLYIWRP
jgi:hypothetical protein